MDKNKREVLDRAPVIPELTADPVVDANCALLQQRSQVGIKKYGGVLPGTLGRRELVQHALEEALDLANYLQADLQVLDRAPVIAGQQAAGSDIEVWWKRLGCIRNPGAHSGEEQARDAEIAELRAALAALDSRAQPVAPRPTDDELWDQTIRDRDTYHEWADKLAEAISKHFGTYIGEHSNTNCPWAEALEAIDSAQPVAAGELPPLPSPSALQKPTENAPGVLLFTERQMRAYGQQCATTSPWLTLAHTICADAGIPPGRIDDRLAALRDVLDSRPAGGAMPVGTLIVAENGECAWYHGIPDGEYFVVPKEPAATLAASVAQPGAEPVRPELTVWEGAMPESNGKSNFTALLLRKGDRIFDHNFTIARSEYPDRVRYEADCVRHIIGELPEWPCIMDYDDKKHSGYVRPPVAAAVPDDPMDWPIPCDVKVGGVTIRQGCKLRTLVTRMESLHRMAVAALPKVTPEQRAEFDALFPAAPTTEGGEHE